MLDQRPRFLIAIALILLLLPFIQRESLGAAIDVDGVLTSNKRQLDQITTWKMCVSDATTWSESVPDRIESPIPTIATAVYIRDGDRRDVDSSLVSAERKSLIVLKQRTVINGYYLSYVKSPEDSAFIAQYAANGSDHVQAIGLGCEPFLEGHGVDPGCITDILKKAADRHLLHDLQLIGGHKCIVVTGNCTPFGSYTLWCDPELGYLARKLVILKSGNDLIGSRKVNTLRFEGLGHKPVALASLTYTVDDFKFTEVGGKVIPAACQMVTRHEYADGNWHIAIDKCERSDIRTTLDRSPANVFHPDLPDGTRLANLEDPLEPYVWQGGKPAPLGESPK